MMQLLRVLTQAVFLWLIFAPSAQAGEHLSWPQYGPNEGLLRIDKGIDRGDGLTNSVPDIVGPMDGSAKLTIFTEGNHYPVLLPLLLEAFPTYCAETNRCSITAADILVVTLPQVMIVDALEAGGFRMGNAKLPVNSGGPVYPDLVMLGEGPMKRLEERGVLAEQPRVFAKHRGMGLLIERSRAEEITDLKSFSRSGLPFVVATTREMGARQQYVRTLGELLGHDEAKALLKREVIDFPGRLAIQHRDIPYAVMSDIAPAGLVFGHLAKFYADHWPEHLAYVAIPETQAFGSEIAVARMKKADTEPTTSAAFLEFFFTAAPEAYLVGGFMPADAFEFGRVLDD
ncbi:substrate-binding domain-containing protein [Erythrobacter rubeus]|uniref:Substrate-binding domain-containing protein n=1 Tax=Erythrobacter rubeus TaxID=2760803 RepID=A0ABR8KZB6_9SPHN|nr:substrate-binding domain-containing protein [Erythrobacter rubeus]MBD2843511.1 substrate-binding domain-containing protein [Erythrobacter rubeus]